jgi:hypothetical protein
MGEWANAATPPPTPVSALSTALLRLFDFHARTHRPSAARRGGPAHQSWTPMAVLSDPLGRLERFGADVAE